MWPYHMLLSQTGYRLFLYSFVISRQESIFVSTVNIITLVDSFIQLNYLLFMCSTNALVFPKMKEDRDRWRSWKRHFKQFRGESSAVWLPRESGLLWLSPERNILRLSFEKHLEILFNTKLLRDVSVSSAFSYFLDPSKNVKIYCIWTWMFNVTLTLSTYITLIPILDCNL